MPTASTVDVTATMSEFRKRLGYADHCTSPLPSRTTFSPPSKTMRSHQGAAAYSSGVGCSRSCERFVISLTKGEISGVNTTVGGMVVARLRGLNEVETIQ